MTDIAITEMEPEHYGVQVREGDVTTSLRVVLPGALLDDLIMTDLDPVRIVEESIRFLLDREPAAALADEVDVATIADRYPDFYDELRARVAPR